MFKFATLLLAVACVVPAMAQQAPFLGTHPKMKPAIVAPASKPSLLHTGKPITQDQKLQLVATAIKASAARTSAAPRKSSNPGPQAAPVTITPDQLYQPGVLAAVGYNPMEIDQESGLINFQSGASSNMTFIVQVSPNTAYMLVAKVYVVNGPANAQFTICTVAANSHGCNPDYSENAPGVQGNDELAYSFVSNSTGAIEVSIFSPNATWDFLSAEVTSTQF